MRINRRTTLLLIALVAAGMLLLLTVAAAQGQGPEPPPAMPPSAGLPAPPLSPPVGGMKGGSAEAGQAIRRAEPGSWRPTSPLAATPVLVIMDIYPWGSTAIQDILDTYGIPYDQVNSSAIPTIDLSPYAVVIIPSDQPQSFYDTYDSDHGKFETYTAGGGVIEFHAAAWGWGGGSLAGIPLPGGVSVTQGSQSYNYVENPTHPLVLGVPNPFAGSSASHGYFTSTITGTTTICTEGSTPGGNPTLIEYPYGSGLVFASGQTLEYGYDRSEGAGIILQNMIPYAYSRATGGFLALVPDRIGGGRPGAVVSHTLTLRNYTGLTDTFDLTATGNAWTTILSITTTGSISDRALVDFAVRVDIPPAAVPGASDVVTVTATSALSPTVYSATATIKTFVVGDLAYVALSDSDLVALVDTASHLVAGSVDVGAAGCDFPWRAAMSPASDYVYVGCYLSDNVAVIETAGNTVVTTVMGIPSASGIAFTRDGDHVLVGSRSNSQIAVVDTATFSITRFIPTPGAPRSIAVHPYLDRAYATCKTGAILVIDTTDFGIIKTIPVSGEPWNVAVSPDGRWVFTGDRWGAGLDVIPVGGNAVYTTVTGLGNLTGLEVAPDGSKIYASSLPSGIRVIDGETFNLITTVSGLGSAWEAATTCDGSELYVTTGRYSDQVPVIDTATFVVTDQLTMPGSGAQGIAICPQVRLPGLHLYPAARSRHDTPGQSLVYEGYLVNGAGQDDSFDLSLSVHVWDMSLSLANTGPLLDGGWISFTAQVTIPPEAMPGATDAATIQAASAAAPTVYSATAAIAATAICSPNLVFSGQSTGATPLDDTHNYGGQGLTYIYLHAHTTSGRDSMNGTVQGYNPTSGAWQALGTWGGAEHLLVDQYDIPPLYSAVRVQLNDNQGAQVYYDYRFIVCRSPAVALNPLSQQDFAQPGATVVYTQTVTNYTMASDSFDLSVSGNSWPTTLWDGSTPVSNTGELADQKSFTFTVQVQAPSGASPGTDEATIQAISVASPAISDTASLRTTVLAYPWVQAFREQWSPGGSTDWEQYLDIVQSSGITSAQMTDDWDGQNSPPAVAAYPRDAIVAAWTGPYRWNGTVNYYNVEYGAFDAEGNTVISVTQVSDNISATIATYDYNPAPAVAPTDGNVLIAWYRYNWPDSIYNVYYAVRDSAGTEALSPTALTTNTTSLVRDYYPSAASFDDGRFAVAWQHYDSSTGATDIHYAVLSSVGDLITGPVNLTHNTWEDDHYPRANRLSDGNVLLTWHGSDWLIYYAVLDSGGQVAYPVTRLTDQYAASSPDAVGLRNGNTVVAWEQYGSYPDYGRQMAYVVLDSAYTATIPITTPTIITNTLSNDNRYVSLARDGDDNAVLTWRDGSSQHVYYGLIDNTGAVRTWPLVFRAARGSQLDVSRWGAGNGSLPTGERQIYLPVVMRNYTGG